MVPAVLSTTTMMLFRKYRPMCASVHAEKYVSSEKLAGSANGLPRKISVLLLNDASSTQISGPAVISAQTTSETCASPVNALISFFGSGLRPPLFGAPAGSAPGSASVPGLLVRFVIASPLADQASTDSRRVTRRVSAAKVRVRKKRTTPSAEA
jgi:hypothetical protein